jgi:hypothetical protein
MCPNREIVAMDIAIAICEGIEVANRPCGDRTLRTNGHWGDAMIAVSDYVLHLVLRLFAATTEAADPDATFSALEHTEKLLPHVSHHALARVGHFQHAVVQMLPSSIPRAKIATDIAAAIEGAFDAVEHGWPDHITYRTLRTNDVWSDMGRELAELLAKRLRNSAGLIVAIASGDDDIEDPELRATARMYRERRAP